MGAETIVDSRLVASSHDHLDVVMVASLLAQPEVDRPAAAYGHHTPTSFITSATARGTKHDSILSRLDHL